LRELRPTIAEVKIEHVIHGGQPGAVICWMAEQRSCDLIVMGTHGRTGLSNVIMGSVAGYVIRHARCPVLTVRMMAEQEAPLPEPVALTPVPPIL
jgi:nucleotide-binding universal stress UspA family protein